MRSTTHRRTHYHDDDDIADPRPWETRVPASTYGSARDKSTSLATDTDLPLFNMDTELDKASGLDSAASEKAKFVPLTPDDQGKWDKGHGAGPGIGGRRGLPPRQRVDGWVSKKESGVLQRRYSRQPRCLATALDLRLRPGSYK